MRHSKASHQVPSRGQVAVPLPANPHCFINSSPATLCLLSAPTCAKLTSAQVFADNYSILFPEL